MGDGLIGKYPPLISIISCLLSNWLLFVRFIFCCLSGRIPGLHIVDNNICNEIRVCVHVSPYTSTFVYINTHVPEKPPEIIGKAPSVDHCQFFPVHFSEQVLMFFQFIHDFFVLGITNSYANPCNTINGFRVSRANPP